MRREANQFDDIGSGELNSVKRLVTSMAIKEQYNLSGGCWVDLIPIISLNANDKPFQDSGRHKHNKAALN